MNKHHTSTKSRLATVKWLPTLFFLAAAAGCGGGGGDSPPLGGTPAPAPAPAPGPAPAPAPAPAMPTITDAGVVTAASVVGTVTFPSGSTATGGSGAPVAGMNCGPADLTVAFYTHLSIFNNGAQVAIPDKAGIVRDPVTNTLTCVYPVHTHTGDLSGRIHQEGPTAVVHTLGDFFAVWGMPLDRQRGGHHHPVDSGVRHGRVVTRFTESATIN